MDKTKNRYWKVIALAGLVVILVFALAGCVPGDGTNTVDRPAGFFWGIWHGWLAPVSLIISIFKGNIRIYEINNVGWLYDLGYYMAIISGFGGLSIVRKTRRTIRNRDNR
ncbi:MAG: hypothetical protein R6W96_09930 [Clostridia bacterium]